MRGGADRRHPSGAGATRMTVVSSIAVRVAEAVADATNGEQVVGRLGVGREVLAKVPDVDVHRAGVAVGGVAPDVLEQHLPGEDPSRRGGEGGEDLELDVGELDLLPAQQRRAALEVDLE